MPTEQEEQWIAAWRRAGPALERIRNKELRELDDEEGTRISTLLGIAVRPVPSKSSGLIEFQKWMTLWREKKPSSTEKTYRSNDVLHVAADLCSEPEILQHSTQIFQSVSNS